MDSKLGDQMLTDFFLKILNFSNFIKGEEVRSYFHFEFDHIQSFLTGQNDLKMGFNSFYFKQDFFDMGGKYIPAVNDNHIIGTS